MNTRIFILGLVTLAVGGAASRAAAQTPDGHALFIVTCKRCHGVQGVPPKLIRQEYPKVATFDSAFGANHSEDSIVTILTNGKGRDMKSFKGKLTLPQMRAVAAYVRELAERPHH